MVISKMKDEAEVAPNVEFVGLKMYFCIKEDYSEEKVKAQRYKKGLLELKKTHTQKTKHRVNFIN